MIQYLLCLFLSLCMHLYASSTTSIFHRAEKTAGPHAADYLNPVVRQMRPGQRFSPELVAQQKELETLRQENQRLSTELEALRTQLEVAETRTREVHGHLDSERRERSESRARRRAIDEEHEQTMREKDQRIREHAINEAAAVLAKDTLERERAASTERHRTELERERRERAASRSGHTRAIEEKDREIARLQENTAHIKTALDQIRNPLLNPFATQENIASYNWTTEIIARDFAAIPARSETEHTVARAAMPAVKGIPEFKGCTVTRSYATQNDKGRSVIGFYIRPPHGQDENTKYIILKVVHGTFSNPGVYGGSEDEKEKTNFHKSILIFAQQLALAYKASVKIDIFGWSGALNPADRSKGGKDLAQDITRDVRNITDGKTPIIWVIAHSHGCNVTNNAAQFLKRERITIDQAILLASPIFDINPLQTPEHTYNIKSVIHLYGAADTTARAGSLETRIKQLLGFGAKQKVEDTIDAGSEEPRITYTQDTPVSLLRKPQSFSPEECVRNIRVKIHSWDTDHLNIADVAIRYLGDILFTLAKDFPVYYDLWVNIYDTKKRVHKDEPARWRPQFCIAQTDKTFTMMRDAPQYIEFLPKDIKAEFIKCLEKHRQTLDNYQKMYNKSMYDITRSPFTGDASTALGYLGAELNNILYHDGTTTSESSSSTASSSSSAGAAGGGGSTPASTSPTSLSPSASWGTALWGLFYGAPQQKTPEEEEEGSFGRRLTGTEESPSTSSRAAAYMAAAGGGGAGTAPRSGAGGPPAPGRLSPTKQ